MMESKIDSKMYLTLFTPTRQEMLLLWLARKKITYVKIADQIGMTSKGVSLLLQRETAPVPRVDSLRNIGIPELLLPEAKNISRGPKPKQ